LCWVAIRVANINTLQALPRLQHEAAGAVLAERAHLLVLQHAERLPGEIGAVHVLGVQNVAQLVARQAVQPRINGIQFGAEDGAPVRVPAEGREADRAVHPGRRGVPRVPARGGATCGGAGVCFSLGVDGRPQRRVRLRPHVIGEGLQVPGRVG